MAAFLCCFGNPAVKLFFQLKTKVANRRKKKFKCDKNERIITFPNKCTSPGSALNCEGFLSELAKPEHVIKHMQEGDVP